MDESTSPYNEQFRPVTPGEESTPASGNPTGFARITSVVLLIITFTLIFYSFNLSSQLSQQEQLLEQQEERIKEIQKRVNTEKNVLSLLETEELKVVALQGLQLNPGGYGKVFWSSPGNKLALQVSNLPPSGNGQFYTLWLISDNQTHKIGSFRIEETERNAFYTFESPYLSKSKTGDTFVITKENREGETAPSGEPYLSGTITSR